MNDTAHAVLFALLDLAKSDRAATVLRLVDATGLARDVVDATLAELDRTGYADASRVRLTMHGLAAAAMLGAPRARRARALRAA